MKGGAPLSILHLHGTFDNGGKEARVVRLMNHWAGKAHHVILLGTPGADAARAGLLPEVLVDIVTEPRLGGPPSLAKFRALAQFMAGFDLVASYNWGAMDGVMAHRLFHRMMDLPPLIHHEDGFNADEATVRKPKRNFYRRIALGSADALVVPSTQLAHVAIAEWHQPSDKVHHIPNGIDVAAYRTRRDRGAIPGLVGDDRLVVGTLAGLRPVKNLCRLVRAAAPLKEQVRLVIVGEGEEREAIAAEAKALGVDLLLPGFLPNPQDYVGAFDIFALSSDSEQFPISLVEAMAAGLPVVATDVGDVGTMVSPHNRPFIVPPGDEAAFTQALADLVADPAERAALGTANQARAARCFDQKGMIDRYARLYGHALGLI